MPCDEAEALPSMDAATASPNRNATDALLLTPANGSDTGLCDEQCKFDRKAAKRNANWI